MILVFSRSMMAFSAAASLVLAPTANASALAPQDVHASSASSSSGLSSASGMPSRAAIFFAASKLHSKTSKAKPHGRTSDPRSAILKASHTSQSSGSAVA
jgi:hypothetical protein